ncbi:MAG: sigma-70 family RNA polymerase sigma factor [Acidobacteria bacterium]|nr:sigma-70 family RNA polymerase sigma factor [Acidobacteriota bacterium]
MFERLRRTRRDGELTDGELHRAALNGSGDAMSALYRRHGGLVYRFTLQMSRNEAVAEEITQEVFLALLTHIDRFDAARGALSTWLCAIARRQLWKHLERDGTADRSDRDEDIPTEAICPSDGPAEILLRREAVDAVRAGLEQLPLALREALVLCALEEMSYEDAAQVLAVPVGTVRSRLHRARAQLAELLRAEMANTSRRRA